MLAVLKEKTISQKCFLKKEKKNIAGNWVRRQNQRAREGPHPENIDYLAPQSVQDDNMNRKAKI